MKKKTYITLLSAAVFFSVAASSCHSSYQLTSVEGTRVAIDSTWDEHPDMEAVNYLKPYKAKVDSMMNRVLGHADVALERKRPESLLSNLLADMLREDAEMVLGHPADMGLMNMGGIRGDFAKGTITCGNVFEVLPFQNALCVVTLKGKDFKELLQNIAARGGEGISGVKMVISRKGELLECSVGGKPVDENKEYTIATLDYLADGNDGMTAFEKNIRRDCPDNAAVRDLFMKYVEKMEKEGKPVTARLEGRLIVKD